MPDAEICQNQLAQIKAYLNQQINLQQNYLSVAGNEEGMVLLLADGSIPACNAASASILEITAEHLQKYGWQGFNWYVIHEDGSFCLCETHPAITVLKTGNPCLNFVCGFNHPNGELVWLLTNSQPLFSGKETQPYGVVTTFTKIAIAPQQESNWQRYRDFPIIHVAQKQVNSENLHLIEKIADIVPGVMYIYDLVEQQNFYVNAKITQLWGYTPAEIQALGNQLFSKLMHPEDLPKLPNHLEKFQTVDANDTLTIEYRIQHANGEWRWFCSYETVYRKTTSGLPQQILGIAFDITERRHTEIALQQTTEELKQANQIKDEFLSILSHELRSPLNPILGWSTLLKTRKFDETITIKALETIEHNAKLQLKLVDDLLDVSRIIRGKLNLNFVTVDLGHVINAALETVRLPAAEKSICIDKHVDINLAKVLGDFHRLQQVVVNLLSNAIKFTPSGQTVEITLHTSDKYAEIIVKDTGQGISHDFLPFVFDYFRQADSSITRKFGGLGLGLAIVHHLLELHGGTVTAASPGENQGATFTVKLPLIQERKAEVSTITAADQKLNPKILTGLKILVVDDEVDTRHFISFLLKQYGAIATTAASATEALLAIAKSPPDLIISDLGMPEVDGYTLMRLIKNLPANQGGNIPAIALTAYVAESDRQKVLAVGFQKHVTKPVDPRELISLIADFMVGRNQMSSG
ncbi:MAG: response regulator [Nostoc sp. TH1S01]|nr:response regulator [Nostoc sp. TH1S01]